MFVSHKFLVVSSYKRKRFLALCVCCISYIHHHAHSLMLIKGPVTQPITHESLTNHAQIGFVRACASRNWPIFRGSGIEITDESRMNHAWTAHVSLTITDESLTYRARRRIRANTVQYSTNIRRTPDAWITDGARPKHARFVNVPRTSTYKHFRSAHVDARPTHESLRDHARNTHGTRTLGVTIASVPRI